MLVRDQTNLTRINEDEVVHQELFGNGQDFPIKGRPIIKPQPGKFRFRRVIKNGLLWRPAPLTERIRHSVGIARRPIPQFLFRQQRTRTEKTPHVVFAPEGEHVRWMERYGKSRWLIGIHPGIQTRNDDPVTEEQGIGLPPGILIPKREQRGVFKREVRAHLGDIRTRSCIESRHRSH